MAGSTSSVYVSYDEDTNTTNNPNPVKPKPREPHGPLAEKEQEELNRMRGRLPEIISRITKEGKMHDINRRRISLVKATTAELEESGKPKTRTRTAYK